MRQVTKTTILYILGNGFEILQKGGKRVKTKSQKFFRNNYYVCRSYRGKTNWRGLFAAPLPSPILNRVTVKLMFFKIQNIILA